MSIWARDKKARDIVFLTGKQEEQPDEKSLISGPFTEILLGLLCKVHFSARLFGFYYWFRRFHGTNNIFTSIKWMAN
jgi:hypothetical protein